MPQGVIDARWPQCGPRLAEPEVSLQTGNNACKLRQMPHARWVYRKSGETSGWKWNCDGCGRLVNSSDHFSSKEQVKQPCQWQFQLLTGVQALSGSPGPSA